MFTFLLQPIFVLFFWFIALYALQEFLHLDNYLQTRPVYLNLDHLALFKNFILITLILIILDLLQFFLQLYPVFTLSSNFPLIAITFRNNLMNLFGIYPQDKSYNMKRILFSIFTIVPALLISAFVRDTNILAAVTGAYPGLAIMFIFPSVLVYRARKYAVDAWGNEHKNPYTSPFSHIGWIILVLICSLFVLGFTIYDQIHKAIYD